MIYFYGNVEWIGDRRTRIKIKNYALEADPRQSIRDMRDSCALKSLFHLFLHPVF